MSSGLAKLTIPIVAVVVFAALAAWFGIKRIHTESSATPAQVEAQRTPQAKGSATADASLQPDAARTPAPGTADQQASATPQAAVPHVTLPEDKTSANAPGAGPSFDVVRVEPNGDSVIAGRGAPGATVDLMANGTQFARAIADPSGLFAFVPPPLPPGSHEVVIQTIAPDGTRARSSQSVVVVIAPDRATKPLVTVSAAGQPTVILSAPDAAAGPAVFASGAPASGPAKSPTLALPAKGGDEAVAVMKSADAAKLDPSGKGSATAQTGAGGKAGDLAKASAAKGRPEVRIASVESESSGRLYVSGSAAPGATLRLYLNDAFVAPGGTGPNGVSTFSIERGVRPGDYRVRLDDVDPVTGTVRSRAEVPFTVPAPLVASNQGAPAPSGARNPAEIRASGVTVGSQAAVGQGDEGQASAGRVGSVSTTDGRTASGEPSPAGNGRVTTASPSRVTQEVAAGAVVVPEIDTALVSRGDNLWRISKRTYGSGLRYTVIYGANQAQIRNPGLIYPGQIFVLPAPDKRAQR